MSECRKRTNGADRTEDDPQLGAEEEEEEAIRQEASPVAEISSQALANAIENGTGSKDGTNGHEVGSDQQSSQGPEAENQSEQTATKSKRKTRNSRSSKPIASSAREPASGGAESNSPQVVIPAVKKIRPGSIFPLGNDVTEIVSEQEEVIEKPRKRTAGDKAPEKRRKTPANDERQTTEPEEDERHQDQERPRKRKATTPQTIAPNREKAKKSRREIYLGQNYELYGQQNLLRQAYKTIDRIGWTFKDGEKYSRCDVDLDDEQVISVKRLCREAKTKFSELKAMPEDREIASDPPEEITWICNEVRALGTTEEYFKDRDKVNNIYFHLFSSLVKLVRDMIDCYGELDLEDDGTTPQRAITIYHLGVVAALLKVITSLYDVLGRRYCAPDEGLCVKQPIKQIIVALRNVQDRFSREIRRHREKEQQKLLDEARAEEARLLDERLEREETLAKERAAIREQWLRLHDERRHVDVNILPRWKIAHLRVPELEPDRDGNGEPFERLELFTPRIGPSVAATEKARQVEWTAIELDALRTGLEEFAGPRLFVKMFRRYCKRGAPLHRFNVTEIVTTAADMVAWIEQSQLRRSGEVDDWVRIVKREMWTRAKIHGSGQENLV